MSFNTKYILRGDSDKEIKDKINYNFNQIISFGLVFHGQDGPKGSDGFAGPSGYKGLTGATGERGSIWYKQNTQPTNSIDYDLWIDLTSNNYNVWQKNNNNWVYSGYSLFNSDYFKTYDNIEGPGGVFDKYCIGFRDDIGLTASASTLTISDIDLTTLNCNQNNTKLLIITDEQITRPILGFTKAGSASMNNPGFYWNSIGNSLDVKFKSDNDLNISAGLGITIDSKYTTIELNAISANINAVNDIKIGGTGDFYMRSNIDISKGGNLNITASNFLINSNTLNTKTALNIASNITDNYVLDLSKNLPPNINNSTSGIVITGNTNQHNIFEFLNHANVSVLSGKPKGSISSGKHGQLNFGSTGGATGLTGGPAFYHVKKINEAKINPSILTVYQQTKTGRGKGSIRIGGVCDIRDIKTWETDIIMVSPINEAIHANTDDKTINYNYYIRIPSSYMNTLEGVYMEGSINKYRIFFNDRFRSEVAGLRGIVYDYYNFSGNIYTIETTYLNFNDIYESRCHYVDITYIPVSNSTNKNPMIFWQSSDGISGNFMLTNRYNIGQVIEALTIPDIGMSFDQKPPDFGF